MSSSQLHACQPRRKWKSEIAHADWHTRHRDRTAVRCGRYVPRPVQAKLKGTARRRADEHRARHVKHATPVARPRDGDDVANFEVVCRGDDCHPGAHHGVC